MKNTKIITDAPSDIPHEIAKELDISVLPIPVTIDDVGYYEGQDFTPVEFYDILAKAKELPVTSQITPPVFLEEYEKCFVAGYKRVLVMPLNSKGSNTYNSAVMAKEMFFSENPDRATGFEILLFDAKSYSLGYGLPLIMAAKMMQEEDKSPAEVVRFLEDTLGKTRIYFTIFSLEYAKKSGRIPAAAAFVGDMLGLRPIMTLEDGVIKIIDKVRGDQKAIDKMFSYAKKVERKNHPNYVLLKGNVDESMISGLAKQAKKEFGRDNDGEFFIGPSITINAGPKVVGLVLFED